MKTLSLLPSWIRNYQRIDFPFDLVAGLTVGVMLIPQGMAYAMLAGLPPIYGLYASTLPAIVYAWYGTSRQLSVGPGALTAMLTASAIGLMAVQGSAEYLAQVTLLVLSVGLIQFVLGISRLGFLVNLLSNPVITGFTAAAAILIGLSQLKHLVGIPLPQSQLLHHVLRDIITFADRVHFPTAIMGLSGLAGLWILQKKLPRVPAALFIVGMAILITWFFRLDLHGIQIVGSIPAGWPVLVLPDLSLATLLKMLPVAFAISLISFMESTAVARTIQARHKSYRVIPNRELIALGLANMTSALLRATPVTGGMSRSMVNDMAGARTGMAAMITAVLILLTLLFFTPLFYYLPGSILAAVILMAVAKLIKWKEIRELWFLDRKDFWMLAATFAGTLFLGISVGIGIGVILSLAWIIFEASYPHHAQLGRVPGTQTFRNLRRFDDLEVPEGVLIFRFDAPLFFANIDRFKEVLLEYRHQRKDVIHTIIIDMESINSIDSSAIMVLQDLLDELSAEHIRVLMTEVKGPVRDKLYLSGLTKKLGDTHFFVTTQEALIHIDDQTPYRDAYIALQTNSMRKE